MQMHVTENWYRPGWNALVVYCRHVQRHRCTILIYSYSCICLCLQTSPTVCELCVFDTTLCVFESWHERASFLWAHFLCVQSEKSDIKSSNWQNFFLIHTKNKLSCWRRTTTSCEHECNRDDSQNQTYVLFIVAVVTEAQAVKHRPFLKGSFAFKRHMITTYFCFCCVF